jgi:hypothetical protein
VPATANWETDQVQLVAAMRRYPADPEFADDLEAAVRELRAWSDDQVTEWPDD